MSKKVFLRILINTLIGIVLIYVWLKIVNINEILDLIKKASPLTLLGALFLMMASGISKALRLNLLLKEYKIPSLKVIYLTFLSQFLSFTIPIRAGEITKGVYLSTHYDIPFSKAVIWIFLDRFLDFWLVIVLSLILLIFIPTNLSSGLISLLSVLVILFTLSLLLIILIPGFFRSTVKFFTLFLIFKRLKKFITQFSEFIIDCTTLLKQGFKLSFFIFSLTFIATVLEAGAWFVLFKQFIDAEFLRILLGSMLNALTFLIPAAPGYAGSAEAAGLAVFSYGLGIEKNIASAVTVMLHGINLIYVLATGILALYLLKFNLKLVWKKVLRKP